MIKVLSTKISNYTTKEYELFDKKDIQRYRMLNTSLRKDVIVQDAIFVSKF